ncbi:MAG: hypothetical protein ACXV47_05265 [Halobacteriota archaeon]
MRVRVRTWVIILLLTGLALSAASVAISAQQSVGTVTITSPPQNSTVGPTEIISGKAQLSNGYTLWIVAHDGKTGQYYPQGTPVTIRNGASWSTHLSLGSAIGVGQKFQIQAVAANKTANKALSSYASSGQKSGMTTLPAGAQAINAITVTRGTSNLNSSASNVPIGTQNVSTAMVSSNVIPESASASPSQSRLPGFEAIYVLGALAIAFAIVTKGRLSK